MNIELKPIAEKKVRQLGGEVCGVLVRTEDSEVMAVSEHGRCTRLDAGVMGPEPIIPSVRFTVEPHGSGYAIYRGRDADHHGENLGHLTECTLDLPKILERALNAQERPEYTVDREFLVQLITDRQKRIDELEKQVAESARAQGGQGAEVVAWCWENHGRHVTVDKSFAKELIADGEIVRPLVYGDTQPQPAVPEAKEIIDRVVAELETGFVRCERCGDQEDTATLDCMTDLKRLKALLSTPTTPQADGWIDHQCELCGHKWNSNDLMDDCVVCTNPAGQEGAQ